MWGVVDDHRKNGALSRADAAASSADSLLVLPCVDSTAQLQRPGFRFAREKKASTGVRREAALILEHLEVVCLDLHRRAVSIFVAKRQICGRGFLRDAYALAGHRTERCRFAKRCAPENPHRASAGVTARQLTVAIAATVAGFAVSLPRSLPTRQRSIWLL